MEYLQSAFKVLYHLLDNSKVFYLVVLFIRSYWSGIQLCEELCGAKKFVTVVLRRKFLT